MPNEIPTKQRYNFAKADYEVIEEKFDSFLKSIDEPEISCIEDIWTKLSNTISESLATIPGKLARPKGHP